MCTVQNGQGGGGSFFTKKKGFELEIEKKGVNSVREKNILQKFFLILLI